MEHAQAINPPAAGARTASRSRWGILAILFIVTAINYADRATISIAATDIRKSMGLNAVEMGYIFSAFA